MALNVRTAGIEEIEHPYYIVRYIIENEEEELVNSVARYAVTPKGATVQFLEPDMRKILTMKVDQPLQQIVDKVVRETVEEYLQEKKE